MMMMRGLAVLLVCGISTTAMAKIKTPTLRDQEQAACYDDATRLCKDEIPNEDKITACMKAKKSQISAGCLKFFK